MNDRERRIWIVKDEGMYNWWKSTSLSADEFVRKYRPEIDYAISCTLNGTRRRHTNLGGYYEGFDTRPTTPLHEDTNTRPTTPLHEDTDAVPHRNSGDDKP